MEQCEIDFCEKRNKDSSPTNNLQFDNKGFLIVKNLVDVSSFVEPIPKERGMIKFNKEKILSHLDTEPQVPGSLSRYNYFKLKNLHEEIKDKVENIIGKKLYTTYFYDRFYFVNQKLNNHVDRDSCEISVTLNISSYTYEDWPLFIKGSDNVVYKVNTNQGDAVLYKGCERPHWREELKDSRNFLSKLFDKIKGKEIYYHQVFFHYVLADGKRAHFAFDRT